MNMSAQRLPGIGSEKPPPVELADRVHAIGRKVRWWILIGAHARSLMLFAVVVLVVLVRFGWLATGIAIGSVVFLLSADHGPGASERRRLIALNHLYQWSSDSARVGLGNDGMSAVFQAPEVRKLTLDDYGRTYTLRTARLTLKEIESACERLKGRWRAHNIIVSIPRPGFCQLRVIMLDPLAVTIPYRAGGPVAIADSAQAFSWTLGDGSTIIGGAAGAGKSGAVGAILASLFPRPDVQVVGIDLKGGLELAPVAARLSLLAKTTSDAHAALTTVYVVMQQRFESMARRGIRMFDGNWLVLVVDELSVLASPDVDHDDPTEARAEAAQRLELLDKITALGRAARIECILSTQAPTAELFGKTNIRSNCTRRVVLRTVSADQSYVVSGIHGLGAELIRADRPGTARIIAKGLNGQPTVRFVYLSDDDLQVIVESTAELARPLTRDTDTPPSDLPTTPGPVPRNSSPTTAPPSEARAEHNDRREAGATDRPRVWPQGIPADDPPPTRTRLALAPIPVSDADLADYWRIRPDQRSLYLQLLAESSGESMSSLAGRLVAGVMPNPTDAQGETAPTFLAPTPASGTPGPHHAPQTDDVIGCTSSPDPLIIPHNDERRRNPATGRPFPAPFRCRWSDGSLRNYPEPAA